MGRAVSEGQGVPQYRGIDLDDRFIPTVLERSEQWVRQHSRASAEWAERIGRELGLADDDVRVLRIAALLHEIEKLGVPPEEYEHCRLTEGEEELLRQSPAILGPLVPEGALGRIVDVITTWPEHFDGSGGPRSGRKSLAGEEIPLFARIVSVACAFLELAMERPGYGPLNGEAALERLAGEAGSRYDPRVLDALETVVDRRKGGGQDETV